MKSSHKRRQSKGKSTPDFPIRIDRLSHEGRGVANWGERVLFVDGALPGELVNVRITQKSSRIAEAVTQSVLVASENRSVPRCPNAGYCGGCSLQHMPHEDQLEHKSKTLDELMRKEGVPLDSIIRLPTLIGPLEGYRRRARLGVRWVHAKDRVLVGFREKSSNFIADISHCPVLDVRIGESLDRLCSVVANTSCPARIPQIEVAAGDDALAVIIRHLDPLTETDLEKFRELGLMTGWHIYLQPKGPDTVKRLWPESGLEELRYRIGEFGLEYRFKVTDFTQINAQINRLMLQQAMSLLDLNGSEAVLDLFCGLGNFTLAAATKAASVTGIEVSDEMVARVLQNANHNGLINVRANAFDLTQSIGDQSWAKDDYDTLILDPPRSGAKELLEQLSLKRVERILYVSCNPATLARDARLLSDRGFRLTHLGIMDMFPETAHVESMALFVKDADCG